ncbi:MAG: hypothetical protein ACKVOW_11785 [Chitinophagaceae bacterium]
MKLLFCLSFLLSLVTGYSQTIPSRSTDGSGNGWMNDLMILDVNGQPFKSPYENVEGSPFLFSDWKFATVLLSQGKKLQNIKVKIDLVSQEAHFVTVNNVEMVTPNGLVREIFFIDSTAGKNIPYKLRTGYPAIDYQNENNFYQLLVDGHTQLLKSVRKKVNAQKNDVSGETIKVLDAYEEYYVFNNGQLKRLKKEKEFVLELLKNQKEKVDLFLKDNKTNFKNPEHLIKLFSYYNSL